MIGPGVLQSLPVTQIQLDPKNPRIRKFVEMYGDNPDFDQMCMALGAAGDDDGESSITFDKLKNSILTNGGVIQPIIVNRSKDGTLICIEGNTRVAIYRGFLQSRAKGNWANIPALVYDDMGENQIDAIRLQAHLVGIRQWDPYSKAKYLYYLRTQEQMPFNQIVDFCGGRQKDVVVSINAFQDMETYYRPVVPDDGSFDTRKFSGFVELQKPGIKEALAEAQFTLTDFSKWIYEEKLYPLVKVRLLPRLLRNPRAKEVFLKEDARHAEAFLDKPDLSKALLEADLGQIAHALTQSLYNLPWIEAKRLHATPGGETSQYLNEALLALKDFLSTDGDGD